MPLYDFVCRDCEREQELLIRSEETPTCESCGSGHMTKLLSVPVAHTASAAGSPRDLPPGGCGSGCGCHGG